MGYLANGSSTMANASIVEVNTLFNELHWVNNIKIILIAMQNSHTHSIWLILFTIMRFQFNATRTKI